MQDHSYTLAERFSRHWIVIVLEVLTCASVIVAIIAFFFGLKDRRADREMQAKQAEVQSWQLLTAKAAGNSGKSQALEYLNSRGIELVGIDLSVADQQHGTYLAWVDLSGANLSNANLSKAVLSGANLVNVSFSEAILDGANLASVDATNASFYSASLIGTNFRSSVLEKVYFEKADFTGADISGADFSGARLVGAIMENLKCDGTNFSNTIYSKKSPAGCDKE